MKAPLLLPVVTEPPRLELPRPLAGDCKTLGRPRERRGPGRGTRAHSVWFVPLGPQAGATVRSYAVCFLRSGAFSPPSSGSPGPRLRGRGSIEPGLPGRWDRGFAGVLTWRPHSGSAPYADAQLGLVPEWPTLLRAPPLAPPAGLEAGTQAWLCRRFPIPRHFAALWRLPRRQAVHHRSLQPGPTVVPRVHASFCSKRHW